MPPCPAGQVRFSWIAIRASSAGAGGARHLGQGVLVPLRPEETDEHPCTARGGIPDVLLWLADALAHIGA